MKKVLTAIFFIILVLMPLAFLEKIAAINEPYPEDYPLSPGLTPHDPIHISNDSDFNQQRWPGNGTEKNPYRIENLSIVSDVNCIDISNVRAHFIIRNCSLWRREVYANHDDYGFDYDWAAISLRNTTTGTISDNAIESHSIGVNIYFSNNTIVSNNTISGYAMFSPPNYGILLDHSYNVTIRDCFIFSWEEEIIDPIYWDSGNITLDNNTFSANPERDRLAPVIRHEIWYAITVSLTFSPGPLILLAQVSDSSGVDTVIAFYSFDGMNYTHSVMVESTQLQGRYRFAVEKPVYNPETMTRIYEYRGMHYFFWANDSLGNIRYTDVDRQPWITGPPTTDPSFPFPATPYSPYLEIIIVASIAIIIGYCIWRKKFKR